MIYLVRHGQTDWNTVHRIQGHLDIPLNQVGRDEALICGRQLASAPIDQIISSDLARAHETAQIINQFFQAPITLDARLREINFGDLQGTLAPEVSDEIWDKYNHNPHQLHAESLTDLYQRVKAFFDELNTTKNTLIVTHGGVIRMALYLAHHPPKFDQSEFEQTALHLKIKNTEIFTWDQLGNFSPFIP